MQREWFSKTTLGLTQYLGMWMGIFRILYLIPAWTGSQHSRSYPRRALTTGTSKKTDPIVERYSAVGVSYDDIYITSKGEFTEKKKKNPSMSREQKLSVESASCSWVVLLWNVMGNVNGLMIRCPPWAKCNLKLSRASIKKEAAVNNYSSQTIMQFYDSCRTGPERKVWQHRHGGGGVKLSMSQIVALHLSALATYHSSFSSQFYQWIKPAKKANLQKV